MAPLSDLQLAVRYRPGGGRVVATPLELPNYNVALPGEDPGTVTETSLLTIDSADSPPSDAFQDMHVTGSGDDELDFGGHVYYVALSLTAPDIEAVLPPTVAAVGVVASS